MEINAQNQKKCCDCGGMHHHHGKKPIIIVVALFIITLIVFFGVKINNEIKTGKLIGTTPEYKNTISVSGDGEIYVKPDLGVISFTVTNEAKTVEAAMADNTTKMNAVITAVKTQGVKEDDVKTTDFNINPKYETQVIPIVTMQYPSLPTKTTKQVLIGYEVTQTIEVKIRDLSKVGEIISSATDAGANDVGSLTFIVDKQDEAQKAARDQAIDKAKAKAQQLADKLGVKLIKVVSFSDNSYYPYYDNISYKAAPMGAGETSSMPQIQTGQNKITATVTITYEIN